MESTREALRRQLQDSRKAMPQQMARQDSEAICQRIAPLLQQCKHIAIYIAFGREVNVESLLSFFAANDQCAYVPIVMPENRMMFAPIDEHTPTKLNQYGIKEPEVDSSLFVKSRQLDAVVVPLVGFDEQCNRMGMGGGYYDRCFARKLDDIKAPALIGAAYESQCVETVHAQSWDVPLDYVVTESRVICNRVNPSVA